MTSSRDAELERGFWRIVFLLNVGPIAVTVGAGLAFLGGLYEVGFVAFAVGGFALLRAAQLYRRYSKNHVGGAES